MNTRIREFDIQRRLESETGGGHQSCLAGIPDIVNNVLLIEIKRWKDWKCALGQIMAYRVCYQNRVAIIHFFDYKPKNPQKLEIIYKTLQIYNIKVVDENNYSIQDYKHYTTSKPGSQSIVGAPCNVNSKDLGTIIGVNNNTHVTSSSDQLISSTIIQNTHTTQDIASTNRIVSSTIIHHSINNIPDSAENYLKEFIEANCTREASVLSSYLWNQYKSYLIVNHSKVSTQFSNAIFTKWMGNLYPELKRDRNTQGKLFLGICLNKDYNDIKRAYEYKNMDQKEKNKLYSKTYYEKNKEKIKSKNKAYKQKRRNTQS